jgi:hypothetical protein
LIPSFLKRPVADETDSFFQTRLELHRQSRLHRGGSGRSDPHLRAGAAELGRLDCRKDFPFGKEWNGKVYATKQVRPVFVDEVNEIVVVTVYTYYF